MFFRSNGAISREKTLALITGVVSGVFAILISVGVIGQEEADVISGQAETAAGHGADLLISLGALWASVVVWLQRDRASRRGE